LSASDHLSRNQFRLFHGTDAKIPKGEGIWPGDPEDYDSDAFQQPRSRTGEPLAFASDSLHVASEHGSKVYELHHNDQIEHVGQNTYGSSEGFKIKREVPSKIVERYKKVFPE
jgi:hypothetical protein